MPTKKKKKEFKHDDVVYEQLEKIPVSLDCDLDRYSNGFLHIAVTNVKIAQNGKDLGNVRVDVQGLAVHALIGGRTWSISVKDLWPIFMKTDFLYLKDCKENKI